MFHLRSLSGEPAPPLRPWDGRFRVELASRPLLHSHVGRLPGGHALGRKLAGEELGVGRGTRDSRRDAGWRCRAASRQTCCAQGTTPAGLGYRGAPFSLRAPASRAVAPRFGRRTPHLDLRFPFPLASACFTATVLGASGKAGIKFFQAGLERAGEGRPSQRQPPWRAGLLLSRRHGHPGSAALGRCQPPRAGWTDPCAAPSHPLRYPHPLPRLRRAPAPASLAPPAPGSLQSPRLPLGSLLRRPGLIPAWGAPRGAG